MHDIFKVYVNGLHTRGPGGVVYVNYGIQRCGYLFPQEFSDTALREALGKRLDETCQHIYVVEERDGTLHLLAYPIEAVQNAIAGAAGNDTGGVNHTENSGAGAGPDPAPPHT